MSCSFNDNMPDKSSRYVLGINRNLSTERESKEDNTALKVASLDADAEHVEYLGTADSERSRKARRARIIVQWHLRRFWCCYMLASIVFLAIFLPIFFVIIIPAVGQRIVDQTDLPVHAAEILDPTPESVTFTLHTSLAVPKLRIHIDPLTLTLFNRDVTPMQPYLKVPLPSYNLKGTTSISVTRNDSQILDESQLVTALTRAVYQRRFVLSAKGSTMGHLGALNAHLKLDKDVELNGLDKLRGFSIESAKLLIPEEDDGANLVGVANLPNHSVVTFALGNVTLNLKSEDLVLGHATIFNALLKPGDNKVSLRGHIEIRTIIDNFSKILAAQGDAISDGNIQLSASGNSTVYNGEHISYYEEILNGLTLTARFPIMKALFGTVEGMAGGSDIGGALQEVSGRLGDR